MTFAATVLTLFPEAFPGPLGVSLAAKARSEGRWTLETVQIREFGEGPHRKVDDTPAGGGPGLVMRADVAAAAIDSVARDGRPLIYPSARGAPFTQAMAREFASGSGLILFCGRFEGLDQRVVEARNMREVCVGEAVLMGGEVAAMLILEAVVRLLPGVIGNVDSLACESFADEGLLEHPQYAKPRLFEGREIPPVLLSGDHAAVMRWRREQAEQITRTRRG